jgi:hypothetical protein
VRFGGSEFKAPLPEQLTNGTSRALADSRAESAQCQGATASVHDPDGNDETQLTSGAAEGGAKTGGRLPTYTGSAAAVYGNSSRETGHTARAHCPSGLPADPALHPSAAVLWITGTSCALLCLMVCLNF